MLYPKIQSVFKRDPLTNFKTFLVDQYSTPEIEYLSGLPWVWTEKIHGTNIRIEWDGTNLFHGGRTEKAQVYPPLMDYLKATFNRERLFEKFFGAPYVTIFGEGYGKKIQSVGTKYLSDRVGFILFDIVVGKWYLKREDLEENAEFFGIPVVPIIGEGTIPEAIEVVQEGFQSRCSETPQIAEGLVLQPKVTLLGRSGARVITKLKYKDFNNG